MIVHKAKPDDGMVCGENAPPISYTFGDANVTCPKCREIMVEMLKALPADAPIPLLEPEAARKPVSVVIFVEDGLISGYRASDDVGFVGFVVIDHDVYEDCGTWRDDLFEHDASCAYHTVEQVATYRSLCAMANSRCRDTRKMRKVPNNE